MRTFVALWLVGLVGSCVASGGSDDQRPACASDSCSGKADDAVESTAFYPIDPQVHVEDDRIDATMPDQVQPSILNPVAYARHAAELALDARSRASSPDAIGALIATAARQTTVPAASAIAYAATRASADVVAARWAEMIAHARGVQPTTAPRIVARTVGVEAQLAACSDGGHAAADCCRALLPIAALLDDPASWSAALRAELDTLARGDDFAGALVASRLAADPAQPFEHQGLKAWLSVCSRALDGLPASLPGVVATHGNFRDASWTRELHPVSMAKLAGRRIYRRGAVSIAESLDASCAVRETELVIVRDDGRVDVASYDHEGERSLHGYFPAGPDRDAIKLTPDSCMGCHYTFDTRRFEVRAPSYRALQLVPRSVDGAPVWRDDARCTEPADTLIWHVPL